MSCRLCGSTDLLPFLDLGSAPPSNAYLDAAALHRPEAWYPLRVQVCPQCWLVQTEDFAQREALFDANYAYFSSFSSSWLAHAQRYVESMRQRLALGPDSLVVEVAANDGYLLRYVKDAGIPCLGIEPTASTAAAARALGIPVREEFFGVDLAERLVADGLRADLCIGNNVLAHVPDLHDFVAGFARLLKPSGVLSFEFPHLLRLLAEAQFDTVYHEHYSYLSLQVVQRLARMHGLDVFDVDELPTHGGSLRVYLKHPNGPQPRSDRVDALLTREADAGLLERAGYADLQSRAETIKRDLLRFLLDAHDQGKRVAAYGAAAKGNTLLNFAGVRPDLLSFVVDRNPAKQGQWMPGSRIPIVDESALRERQPDYIVFLPWNLRNELSEQLAYSRDWGAQWVTAVPSLQVF